MNAEKFNPLEKTADTTATKGQIAEPTRTKRPSPPVAEFEPERARLPEPQEIKLYSEDENYVGAALERLGQTLKMLRNSRGWKNSTLLEYLDVEHFSRAEQISRIIENKFSGRPPTAGQMFDLRRVFGISLDAIADGENPFEVEQMSDARLAQLMELMASELAKRFRQR